MGYFDGSGQVVVADAGVLLQALARLYAGCPSRLTGSAISPLKLL